MASGPPEDGPPGGWGAGPNPLVDAPHCQKPGGKKPKVSLADLGARPWGGGGGASGRAGGRPAAAAAAAAGRRSGSSHASDRATEEAEREAAATGYWELRLGLSAAAPGAGRGPPPPPRPAARPLQLTDGRGGAAAAGAGIVPLDPLAPIDLTLSPGDAAPAPPRRAAAGGPVDLTTPPSSEAGPASPAAAVKKKKNAFELLMSPAKRKAAGQRGLEDFGFEDDVAGRGGTAARGPAATPSPARPATKKSRPSPSTAQKKLGFAKAAPLFGGAGVVVHHSAQSLQKLHADAGAAPLCVWGLLLEAPLDAQGSASGVFFDTLGAPTKAKREALKQLLKARGSKGLVAEIDRCCGAPVAVGVGLMFLDPGRVARGAGLGAEPLHVVLYKNRGGYAVDQSEWAQKKRVDILDRLLAGRNVLSVCFDFQHAASLLIKAGRRPGAGAVSVADPRVLAWMANPEILSSRSNEAKRRDFVPYNLLDPCADYKVKTADVLGAAELSADPVARLKQRLVLSAVLLDRIQAAATHLGSEVLTNEMQIAFLLARLQNTGICFDLSYNMRSERKVSERLAHLNRRAESIAGKAINLRSAKQVGDVLYDKLGYTVPSKKGTARTSQRRTDEETLKALEKEGEEAGKPPLPAIVLESRKLSQYLAKWVNAPWIEEAAQAQGVQEPRICSRWNQLATATGRLSCADPNLQAVTGYTIGDAKEGEAAGSADTPQKQRSAFEAAINIRNAFKAPPGRVLLAADYSQIELRVMAHLSGDKQLISLMQLSEAGGGDIFTLIAKEMLGVEGEVTKSERNKAKRIVYALCYGMGVQSLARTLEIRMTEATQLREKFLGKFPGVQKFLNGCKEESRKTGYTETFISRRRRYLPDITSAHDPQQRDYAERQAINTPIQAGAADLIKLAMCRWLKWEEAHQGRRDTPMLLAMIHDELLFEVDAAADLVELGRTIKDIMCNVMEFKVPITVKVETGERWGEMRELPIP